MPPQATARKPRIRWGWRFNQWIKRTRPWRAVADLFWRFQGRNRITERYPKTTATLAWFLSLGAAIFIYHLLRLAAVASMK